MNVASKSCGAGSGLMSTCVRRAIVVMLNNVSDMSTHTSQLSGHSCARSFVVVMPSNVRRRTASHGNISTASAQVGTPKYCTTSDSPVLSQAWYCLPGSASISQMNGIDLDPQLLSSTSKLAGSKPTCCVFSNSEAS